VDGRADACGNNPHKMAFLWDQQKFSPFSCQIIFHPPVSDYGLGIA
jgi:hypothetical protein